MAEHRRSRLATPPNYKGGKTMNSSSLSAKALASVDWLTLTFKGIDVDRVVDHFGGGVLVENYHMNFYDQVWALAVGGFCMAHTTRVEMGVCVALSGRPLDELRYLWGTPENVDLVRRAVGVVDDVPGASWSCSRIDAALDDLVGALDLETMADDVEARRFTSRWHGECIVVNRRACLVSDPPLKWIEINFGSSTSDAYLRIYDKRAERICKGEDASELPDHWVRVEPVFKGAQATAAVQRTLDDGSLAWVGGVLRSKLEFREPVASVKAKCSWPVASWWQAFLGDVRDRLHVLSEVVEKTVESARAWIEHQVAPTLAFLLACDGGDMDWLRSLPGKGRERMNILQQAILEGMPGGGC